MKTMIYPAIAIVICIFVNSSNAQFDFGKVIKGEGQRMMRDIERQVVDQIRNELKPPVRTLPYPPKQTLPYPPPHHIDPPYCRNPPIIVNPVEPPANSGSKISSKKPVKLPEIEIGSVITIEGKGFGKDPGAVFVKIESLVLSTELVDWNDGLAEAKMPKMPIAAAAKATVFVMTAQEEVVEQLDVSLIPASEEEVETEEPAEASIPAVHSGQEVTLEGSLGDSKGRVELQIGQLRVQASVVEWSKSETTVKLPKIDTSETLRANLVLFRADGEVAEQIEVDFSSKQN